jgi:hypothetical protein
MLLAICGMHYLLQHSYSQRNLKRRIAYARCFSPACCLLDARTARACISSSSRKREPLIDKGITFAIICSFNRDLSLREQSSLHTGRLVQPEDEYTWHATLQHCSHRASTSSQKVWPIFLFPKVFDLTTAMVSIRPTHTSQYSANICSLKCLLPQ